MHEIQAFLDQGCSKKEKQLTLTKAVTCLDQVMTGQRLTVTLVPVGGHNVVSKVEVNERKMKLGSLSRLQKKHNILSQMSLAMDREEVTHGIMGLQ